MLHILLLSPEREEMLSHVLVRNKEKLEENAAVPRQVTTVNATLMNMDGRNLILALTKSEAPIDQAGNVFNQQQKKAVHATMDTLLQTFRNMSEAPVQRKRSEAPTMPQLRPVHPRSARLLAAA